ncbi:hypothetical protein DSO57_1004517 [Entomophthora muscae]|uniref:Uncharacterized protein n=1 Tax=Entomophthora muscae TaxID=34485 RepID=A0ACC2RN08_9FUNG|nr:hypothetical protein DSO57_1004517 [Entomophthora muscae]
MKVFRRFGCPLCRYEAKLLSELKPTFEELGIELIGVGFEENRLGEFITGGFWAWQILIDTNLTIHNILELPKLEISRGLDDLVNSVTRNAVAKASRLKIIGDAKGDGFQMGGTFVFEKTTGKMLFAHRQTGAGNFPSFKELIKACGGDPNSIEEKYPRECLTQ